MITKLNGDKFLIDNDIKTEMIYSGTINKKLKRANKTSSEYAIIIGENELENNLVQLKNLRNGKQLKLNINDVLDEIKK